jgi:hypothetical protein
VSLYFTQLASDNFQYANINPLPSPPWSIIYSGYPGLQVVSELCEPVLIGDGVPTFELYTGTALPNNQYASVTIETFLPGIADSSIAGLVVRGTGGASGDGPYQVKTGYVFNLGYGSESTVSAGAVSVIDNDFGGFSIGGSPVSFNPGDVWTLAVVGATVYILFNGTVYTSGVDSNPIASGQAGLGAGAFVTGSNVQFSNFACGFVSTSAGPSIGTIIEGKFQNQGNQSNAVMGAFPTNAAHQQLDLIQIIATGGQVVWKLDYTGTVTVSPATWTRGTLLGQFSGSSFAACFQQNNTNPLSLDLLQIRDTGGSIVWWLDYTGTVQTSA